MKLVNVRLGIDDEGFATVVGYLSGRASDGRAKWKIGFGVVEVQGALLFIVHQGDPSNPILGVSAGKGAEFMRACLEKGAYKAITMGSWAPERVGSEGWMSVVGLNPLHREVVGLDEENLRSFGEVYRVLGGM